MNFTASHTGASINPGPGTPLDFSSPPPVPGGGTAIWPPLATWQSYGLSSGLSQPAGTTVYTAFVSSGTLLVYLQNAGAAAFDDLVSQFALLGGTSATSSESGYRIYEHVYTYSGANFTLTLTYGSGVLILSIEPGDPSGFTVWLDNSRWTAFNLSGLTQPAGTTVDDVTETASPSALLSVTLNNINHTAYEDLLNQIRTRLGTPYTSTGSSTTQAREDVFVTTMGADTLIVTLEMDTAYDEITISAIK
jgi:hypothetical protein